MADFIGSGHTNAAQATSQGQGTTATPLAYGLAKGRANAAQRIWGGNHLSPAVIPGLPVIFSVDYALSISQFPALSLPPGTPTLLIPSSALSISQFPELALPSGVITPQVLLSPSSALAIGFAPSVCLTQFTGLSGLSVNDAVAASHFNAPSVVQELTLVASAMDSAATLNNPAIYVPQILSVNSAVSAGQAETVTMLFPTVMIADSLTANGLTTQPGVSELGYLFPFNTVADTSFDPLSVYPVEPVDVDAALAATAIDSIILTIEGVMAIQIAKSGAYVGSVAVTKPQPYQPVQPIPADSASIDFANRKYRRTGVTRYYS